jgi:hypothetical protein
VFEYVADASGRHSAKYIKSWRYNWSLCSVAGRGCWYGMGTYDMGMAHDVFCFVPLRYRWGSKQVSHSLFLAAPCTECQLSLYCNHSIHPACGLFAARNAYAHDALPMGSISLAHISRTLEKIPAPLNRKSAMPILGMHRHTHAIVRRPMIDMKMLTMYNSR